MSNNPVHSPDAAPAFIDAVIVDNCLPATRVEPCRVFLSSQPAQKFRCKAHPVNLRAKLSSVCKGVDSEGKDS
ncbi:hypothetical protein CC1G_14223 [Coprinopsis cinerea okayama7|uniref:Uncharacterized protein n=1 Tax=Coprinopsis cinerea (strain Okayama-7 / 130 / ATCC MYA-4618 / FGSC 9003) TaxID=240176 RepID=D6RL88_COPC7|nr:hypothetical protein CC1G_14223 [Coprinopsis cinerea okayama7\|eukprot:XP_002911690.1 hypothetical protein CC1G_14223 [Coprinopsis cinerea okayama7\